MANLLKPSVDQAVFRPSSFTDPVHRRPGVAHETSFLAHDEAAEPVAKKFDKTFAGLARAIATMALLVAGLAITGRL
jgi:hypothetical protein